MRRWAVIYNVGAEEKPVLCHAEIVAESAEYALQNFNNVPATALAVVPFAAVDAIKSAMLGGKVQVL